MAQNTHENPPRISQVLPTVKCSSCGQPVPLASLGDHVCPPLPPPSLLSLQKPPTSPKSAASLLPQRLQSLVARSGTPPHKSSSEKPSEAGEPVLAPSRDPFHRPPPDISHVTTPKSTSPKTPPSSVSVPHDRDRPERVPTPARDAIPPSLQRIRTPSNASRITLMSSARAASSPESTGYPAPTRPTAIASVRPPQQPLIPSPSSFNGRPPLITVPPSTIHPHHAVERVRTPSTPSTLHPPLDGTSLEKLPPALDVRRPSLIPPHPSAEQNPSAPLPTPFAKLPRPALASGSLPFPSSASAPPPSMLARQPPPPPLSLVYPRVNREIDTKIGGEAGMAGVGRRGFEAAARAAMFAASRSPSHVAPLGDGHRANVPRYLDINATFGHVIRAAAITPPLSPNSAHTPSPVSPFPVSPVSLGNSTPTSTQYHNLPSPHDAMLQRSPAPVPNDKALPLSFSASEVRIVSPSCSPSPIPNPFERRHSGETVTQSPMPGTNMPLPLLDVLKSELEAGNESDDDSVYTTHTDLKKDENGPLSPSADSDVGLAYTHDSENDTPVVMPLDIRKSAVKPGADKVKFPTSVLSNRKHPSGPSRQTSDASSRSFTATSSASSARSRSVSAATQSTTKSLGALERAMESLIEEGACVSVLASGSVLASIGGPAPGRGTGKPSRSNTVPGPASPEQKPPKLPTRSHTSPSHPHVHSERVGLIGEVARIRNGGSLKRRERICVGCDSKIDDGRWIQMDGGKVLCERCWKNMYLPKCRRCNVPIEKQAVSSRDGQLKGKYHKECFNCHSCQKPFPDKEFYVLDGKPFCAYHYHEANNSLCGAPSCGQPIEGPCAVTHLGKRYHPEHLLCEFEDGCKERLEEYWEVDGQMFCERHAAIVNGHDGGWIRAIDAADGTHTGRAPGVDEGRMMKRMTRFIDLGAGGDDEPD